MGAGRLDELRGAVRGCGRWAGPGRSGGGKWAVRGGARADTRADQAKPSRTPWPSAAARPAGGRAAASMVLVLHHILIAVVQFLRRGQQVFLKPDEPPPPQPCADSLQVGPPPPRPALGTRGTGCWVSARPGPPRSVLSPVPWSTPSPNPPRVGTPPLAENPTSVLGL